MVGDNNEGHVGTQTVQIDGAAGMVVNANVGQPSQGSAAGPAADADIPDFIDFTPMAARDAPWTSMVSTIGTLRWIVAAAAVTCTVGVMLFEAAGRLIPTKKVTQHVTQFSFV